MPAKVMHHLLPDLSRLAARQARQVPVTWYRDEQAGLDRPPPWPAPQDQVLLDITINGHHMFVTGHLPHRLPGTPASAPIAATP